MFEFASFGWIILLPLPMLVYRMLKAASTVTSAALFLPFYHEVQAWVVARNTQTWRYRQWLMVLIWCLLVAALMRPQWLGQPVALEKKGRDILLALDVSVSMETRDMTWRGRAVDRLAVVKAVASDFIKARSGDRLGLILFGSRAYVQTPLTFDLTTVRYMLKDATVGLAGSQTAMGDAMGLAVKHFANSKSQDKVLVLLTDGVHNAGEVMPLDAAALAANYGVKIYTIGIGAEQMVVPSLLGAQVVNPSADLDESTLRTIAKKTGGLFFRSQDTETLRKIYQRIDELEPKAYDGGMFSPKVPYHHWPLALAFLLSLVLAATRIRGVNA